MITHNYYIDFLKAFNVFLRRALNPGNQQDPTTGKNLTKIEYNIGSKTLLNYDLYHNENFEYPNAVVDLTDIRVAEGVSSIARNVFRLFESPETALLTENYTKNDRILCETKRYILNFNVQINVETSADLLNFYHLIANNIPINFTFIDFTYYYFINISDFAKDWDFEHDAIYNVIKMPDETERDKEKYFSLLSYQPQLEIDSITKNEDKENNKYSLTISMLASTQIPFILYKKRRDIVKRIMINIDTSNYQDYPVLVDIDENVYNNVKKSIVFKKEDIKLKIDDQGFKYYQINFNGKYSENKLSIYLQDNYIDPFTDTLFIPLDTEFKENTEIIYDEENNLTIVKLFEPKKDDQKDPDFNGYQKLNEFLNSEQYNNKLSLFQLMISKWFRNDFKNNI